MTIYGVVGDIHGNREALAEALRVLARLAPDRVVCLGDIVGYNPDGDACVALLKERGVECIEGNHDLIALGKLGFQRCSPKPAHALKRTRKDLSSSTREFLDALPRSRVYEDRILLIHGGMDDVSQYMTTPERIANNRETMAARFACTRICFFGHTHVPKVYEVDARGVAELRSSGTVKLDRDDRAYFVNPGSIDASRRRSKLAQFAVFDSRSSSVTFYAVPYDHRAVERRATLAGYRLDARTRLGLTARGAFIDAVYFWTTPVRRLRTLVQGRR